MKIIYFRYNRHHTNYTEILLFLIFWILGLLLGIQILRLAHIAPSTRSSYWQLHNHIAAVITFLFPCTLMLCISVPVHKFWCWSSNLRGKLEISRTNITLYLGETTFSLKKGAFLLMQSRVDFSGKRMFNGRSFSNRFYPYLCTYWIRQGSQDIYITESFQEGWQLTTRAMRWGEARPQLSLSTAIQALSEYAAYVPMSSRFQ